jgi:hypothetical protein
MGRNHSVHRIQTIDTHCPCCGYQINLVKSSKTGREGFRTARLRALEGHLHDALLFPCPNASKLAEYVREERHALLNNPDGAPVRGPEERY